MSRRRLHLLCAIFSVVVFVIVNGDESPDFNFVKSFRSIKNTTYTTFKKSFTGVTDYTSGRQGARFKGGCNEPPTPPINGQITCSSESGCRANCKFNHKFPTGENQLAVTCRDGAWHIPGTDWTTVPHCEPICLPECQNNGICVAPSECHCPQGFSGPQCQFENKPCLNYPPPALNSRRQCNSKSCTISCLENFVFPNGASVANLICKNGIWQPTRVDWVSIPDCEPVCFPPCKNGGNCLPLNMCQCPQEFRGPQCQYSINACTAKNMGFNGGYQCTGNSDQYSCTLSCPDGIEFTSPPAAEYVCTYERGTFEPQPIPQCKIGENYRIVPVSSSQNSFMEVTNRTWLVENVFGSKSAPSRNVGAYYGMPDDYSMERSKSVKNGVKGGRRDKTGKRVKTVRPGPKTCFTWGGVHYKTFDGAIYSFESTCTYTLIQETRDNSFTITVENSPGCASGGLCHRIIKIFKLEKEYSLQLNDAGVPTFRSKKKALPIPSRLTGLRVEMVANFLIVTLDSAGVTLKWDGRLLVQVEASESLWNRTTGLCGRMNGDGDDDLIEKGGSYTKNVATLTSSWRVEGIGELCDEPPNLKHSCLSNGHLKADAEEFCSKLLADPRFRGCAGIVDVSLLKNACQWDYCSCNESDRRTCACNTLNVYVRQCAHQKIVSSVGWRRNDTCPITCSNGRIYMACGPETQPSCGSDLATKAKDNLKCEEGCFCPEGTMLHEGSCISADECPCRLRGKLFQPGASVPKGCNTCTCLSGKWICTQTWCSARCAAIGDPHYVTFDGKHYDFMGKCNYYLLKGDDYSIETENVACLSAISESMGLARSSSDKPSCTKSVTIRMGSDTIKLKQGHQITVNGEDATKLPMKIGGMKLRIASSIYVIVNMPNGLEIWWDSISRVYVNAPPTFRGKTSGLCGTFTVNQRDDFLTPDGDVEQSVVPFANKWKTNERCSDVPREEFNDPCDANPQNQAEAKKHCSKLWSQLFSECHWHVDPETYYKDCMFDMCACESKIEQCLCPTIAAYAQECAAIGVKIPWRLEIEECKIHCPRDQEYQICGNSCTRSCGDISFHEDCKTECVEGCNCPEGQSLDVRGECIPIGQCPCSHAGLEFRAGYREVRPGLKSQELCTCAAGRWNCLPATPDDILTYPAATGLQNVCTASKNLKISSCEPLEPRTCRNMHKKVEQSPAICRPGCVCKSGYVLDMPSGVCVKEEECPCYHGGKSYKEGASMNHDCNTCKCENGKWTCTDRPCAGVCTAWGDSHYKTFDGRLYDFQGVCDYVLVKARLSTDEVFQVSTQNVPCGNTGVSCSKSITFSVGSGAGQESITLTRGKEVGKVEGKRITMRKVGLFVFLDCPDLGVVVQWDQGTRALVKVDPKWRGHTKGLCGDYNNDSEDDYKTPSGGISEAAARLFADSWKKEDYCSEPKEILDTCKIHPERRPWAVEKCGVLKTSVFEACHSEVDLEPYLKMCIFDTCACDSGGDCECLCTALAAYAHECNAKGAPVKWRSQELCPVQCDIGCSSYSPCMSTCPPETCDNLVTLKSTSHLCSEDTCVEGCLPKPCPDGHVYRNDSFSECVPKQKCKLFCLTVNGTTYYEGDEVGGDDCQSCSCSRGKIICNGVPCTKIPSSTAPPTVVQMEQMSKCRDGWSAWMNKDSPAKGKPSFDVEPLPTTLDMLQIAGSAVCTKEHMVDIRCRSVGQHKTPKETALNVECSLERGLYCEPDDTHGPCLDFEISVLCQCQPSTTGTTAKSTQRGSTPTPTIPLPTKEQCNATHPNQPHPTDCRLFYQCADSFDGIELVEKSCGGNMLYNPVTQVCDWPASVLAVRPDCAPRKTQTRPPTTRAPETTRHPSTPERQTEMHVEVTTPGLCDFGEHWSECAVACNQTCGFYYQQLRKSGQCVHNNDCIEGCTKIDRPCSRPSLWRDEHTCVNSADCTCVSHDGKSVKPGAVIRESECEVCQCLNNYYTCDNSLCATRASVATTSTSRPSTETTHHKIWTPLPESTEHPKTEISRHTTVPIEEYTFLVTSYVSEVPECVSKYYQPFHESSLAGKMQFNASTSFRDQPINDVVTFEWQPGVTDKEQWLSIELPHPEPIYGLMIMGSNFEDKYVTSYKVLFSEDGRTYSYIMEDETEPRGFRGTFDKKVPRVFRGPIDRSNPVKQIFDHPIEAKIIRINPKTWHNGIAVRADLLGCGERPTTVKKISTVPSTTKSVEFTTLPSVFLQTTMHTQETVTPVCDEPMGFDRGLISEKQITASSTRLFSLPNLKMSAEGLWRPKIDNPHQYVQFDFLENRNLTGVNTKGADGIWTSAYKVLYSVDGREWNPIVDARGAEKEFLGNFDDSSARTNYFDRPIQARYLRINPVLWHNHVGLKAEILGCYLPYPTIPATTTTPVTETIKSTTPKLADMEMPCNVCDGVIYPTNEICTCNDNYWWNGESCVPKHECPCVVGSITYAVGKMYETDDCQQCICSLGGASTCKPKECEPCKEPGLQPIVTELCSCICKPCREGTRLCPTSKICIDESLWCNGVDDCSDDETACPSMTPKAPLPTSHVQTGTTSSINVTTIATLNVTKADCEKPVCAPGYKHVVTQTDYTKTKNFHRSGRTKSFTKGSNRRHQVKKPRHPGAQPTDESLVEKGCPQFSCVPAKPPPTTTSPKQNMKRCPKVECPPGYRVVYEKLSMYKLVACPKYTCSPPPPVEVVCNVTGRTFNTFDNLEYKYDICNHILARYLDDNKWYITLEKHCSAHETHCKNVLAIMQDETDIVLYPDLSVDVGDYTYTPRQLNLLEDNRGPFKICRVGDTLYFTSNKYGFWVMWDKNSNVKIGVTTKLVGHVDGLCGYFDGDVGNDRQKPDGTLAKSSSEFGNSWIMDYAPQCETQVCPHDVHERAWEICGDVRDKSLKSYANLVDLEKFVSRCLESTCTCILGNATEEDCRCRVLLSFLKEYQAADHSVDISNWRTIHNCPVQCPAPFVHDDCFKKKCEISCTNLQEPDPCPVKPGVCFSGCFCPDGMVRNGDDCVHPSECRDCVCNGFGNANFITFDKRNFTFIGNCTYVLSRNINKDGQAKHTYEILMTNVPCKSGVCTETITVLYENHVIKISKHQGTAELEQIVDGSHVVAPRLKNSWLNLDGSQGHNVVILIPEIQLEVTIFVSNLAFTIKLPSYTFAGAMEGFCGNCNGMIDDDLKLKNVEETTDNVDAFGMSWLKEDELGNSITCSSKPRNECETITDEINSCTVIEDLGIFGKCHEFNDPTTFVDSCKKTLCEHGDICGIIDAYARSCAQAGLCVDWRSRELCPYQCPPHLEYQPCGSRCKKTCDNLAQENCQSEPAEGCYCPENQVLHNGTCIPADKCLVCDEEGHVEGDVWHPDKCTSCLCSNKTVRCEKTDCSVLETICEDHYTPLPVAGSEDYCCPKYYCAPVPTSATICPEQQQPECGFGQIMKVTTDVDGCQRIICECMPVETCPTLDTEISLEVEVLEPGYVQVKNTSGCCPRMTRLCKPETCPSLPMCPKYHTIRSKQNPDSCCAHHECELSPDVCLLSPVATNDLSKVDSSSARKVGEEWKEGNCKTCTCKRSGDARAMVNCFETQCPNLRDEAEASEFVLETEVIEGQCCPVLKRKACRQGEDVYDVNDKWHPNPADICSSIECVNATGVIEKKLTTQNCEDNCELGYRYVPSKDKSVSCCGECVAVGCVIDGKVRNIGEKWHSSDYCTAYECITKEGLALVKQKIEECPEVEESEKRRFEMEAISSPEQCCKKHVRRACIYDGKVHEVGEKWTLKDNQCVTEMCVRNPDGVTVTHETKICNTNCPVGWRYEAPSDGQCCGECKQAFCTVNDNLYEPGAVWHSHDNCTRFTCLKQANQFIVTSAAPVCPDISECSEHGSSYFDGCCKRCNITTMSQTRACAADVLDLATTVGILKVKRARHGICTNLKGIEGFTECHGGCSSSTHFDTKSWKQIRSCECCQPNEMHTITVELTCQDGTVTHRDLTVPASCSCETCGSLKQPVKGR